MLLLQANASKYAGVKHVQVKCTTDTCNNVIFKERFWHLCTVLMDGWMDSTKRFYCRSSFGFFFWKTFCFSYVAGIFIHLFLSGSLKCCMQKAGIWQNLSLIVLCKYPSICHYETFEKGGCFSCSSSYPVFEFKLCVNIEQFKCHFCTLIVHNWVMGQQINELTSLAVSHWSKTWQPVKENVNLACAVILFHEIGVVQYFLTFSETLCLLFSGCKFRFCHSQKYLYSVITCDVSNYVVQAHFVLPKSNIQFLVLVIELNRSDVHMTEVECRVEDLTLLLFLLDFELCYINSWNCAWL